MNNLNFKIFLIIFLFLISTTSSYAKISVNVIYKINEKLITNIDLENEKKFLTFLNPDLNNLSLKQINEISLNSLINRKIKEVELDKYFDLKKENLGELYLQNFVTNTKFLNMKNLKTELNEINLNFDFFKFNFLVDNLWREFIYNKFKLNIKLDIEKLKKQIENNSSEIEELNLSEILFQVQPGTTIEEQNNNILLEIEKSGFEAAASIYSISESKNFGGNLGWIKSNQISKNIYNEIKKNQPITKPIKTQNGYLIIKIKEKRKIIEEINLEEELQKLISKETENELNKLGYIYFNKIKKRTFISET